MTAPRPTLPIGTTVRFPVETRPWQSGVLRDRWMAVRAGATGTTTNLPFRMGSRGWVVYVDIPYSDIVWRWKSPDHPRKVYRKLCSVRELEAVT